MHDELFTTEGAAGYMKCSVPYVRRLKRDAGGPRYIQRGRFVRYSKSDLDAFVESHLYCAAENGAHHHQHGLPPFQEEANAQSCHLRQIGGIPDRKK